MKIRFALGALIPALALSACGGQSTPAADDATTAPGSTAVTTSPVAVSATPTVPVKGEKPSRAFVIGKWGTDGDCALAIELRPDGTSDGPFGNWSYNDGVIGFVDEPDFKVSVTVIDERTMASTNDSDGAKSTMTRCP